MKLPSPLNLALCVCLLAAMAFTGEAHATSTTSVRNLFPLDVRFGSLAENAGTFVLDMDYH